MHQSSGRPADRPGIPTSIVGAKVDRSATTAASGTAPRQNFAVPPSLGSPGKGPKDDPGPRSISDLELSFVHASVDFVGACLALPLSLYLLSHISTAAANAPGRLGTNTVDDSLFPIAVVVALALSGMYRATHRRLQPSAFLEIRELSFGVGSGCVLALAVGALLHVTVGLPEPVSTQLVLAVVVGVVVISLCRIVARSFLHHLTSTRVLVVGSGTLVDRIMLSVTQDRGMTLVGRAVDGDDLDGEALGRVSDLPRLCRELHVDRILVASPNQVSTESLNTYRELQESVHIAMVPRYYELVSWRSRLSDLAGMPFLEIARPHLSAWDQFMKRLFDVSISGILLLLTAPLLLLVAIGVKFSSPGPVFFRQIRIGRDQLPFTLVKFRSMTVAPDDATATAAAESDHEDRPLHEVRHKAADSGRITRFGAFLRRTGLDEIPQFLNVFRGDMSVVGPRPFIAEEASTTRWGTRRFNVRPGITGLWQVSGRNDLTRTDLVQLDYLYVASWSLWWDLKIMWETPKTMARGTGAY